MFVSVAAGSSLQVCVFWGLLTCHTFFAFGHSATVTSLRFECAFTGIHGEINSFNLPLAGALVGLNTLGPQVSTGLAYSSSPFNIDHVNTNSP